MRTALYITVALLLFTIVLEANTPLFKSTPELAEIIDYYRETGEKARIFISLKEQYGNERLYGEVRGMTRRERRAYTISTLKEFSLVSQAGIRDALEKLETDGLVTDLNYFWLSNIISMQATAEAIEKLDLIEEIDRIVYDKGFQVIPESEGTGYETRNRDDDRHLNTRSTTNNVTFVRAPEVWDEGYTGQGVIVAVLDTGVNYNHQDLQNRMWTHVDYPNHGYDFAHDDNDPMDFNSHGTHCAGTVAGEGTAGTQTGIAPGATIMAVQVIEQNGSAYMIASMHGLQFSLDYGADILSMSYGWANANETIKYYWRSWMGTVLAVGVVAAVATGNEGNSQATYPIPNNVRTPGNCPPPWLHPDQTLTGGLTAVVAVGSVSNNGVIASSSSRGPVTWEDIEPYEDYPYSPGMGLIRPDITTQGASVTSTAHNDNGGYSVKSGTSMAAPGVAGVMALMLSKNPGLTPEQLSQIIQETAVNKPETKSNDYGAGRIDALNAVTAVPLPPVTEDGELTPTGNANEDYTGNIGGTSVVFTPDDDETITIDVDVTVSNDPAHPAIQLFSNPGAIGKYFKFTASNGTVFRNGTSISLQFAIRPNQSWFRQGSGNWSQIPAAYLEWDGVSGMLTIDLTFITDGGFRSEVFEFAGDDGQEGSTLPVQLSSFTAILSSDLTVSLQWVTETETNMLGYKIYRAEENLLSAAGSITPAYIKADNTSTARHYSFQDREVLAGKSYYYWLEMIELDLTSSFTGSIMVNVVEDGDEGGVQPSGYITELIGVFPNPFNISAAVGFSLQETDKASVAIYNVKGQIVRVLAADRIFSKGLHTLVWDGKDESGTVSPTGVYLYRLETDGGYAGFKKMMLLK